MKLRCAQGPPLKGCVTMDQSPVVQREGSWAPAAQPHGETTVDAVVHLLGEANH